MGAATSMIEKSQARFSGVRDQVLTPLVITAIMSGAALAVWGVNRYVAVDLLGDAVLFALLTVLLSLTAIRLLLAVHPLRPGLYHPRRHATTRYVWNLYCAISTTALSFQFMNGLIPPTFRLAYYRLLGLRSVGGTIVIGGRIQEPWLVTLEGGSMIGDGALLLTHALTASDALVLGTIHVGSGAMIGAGAIIMPNVVVGEGATVNPMTVVPMNTRIAPGEVWRGIPS